MNVWRHTLSRSSAVAWFLFVFLISYSLSAANLDSKFSSRVWQIGDGLPHNTVMSICQTRDGYLWAGTREGVARFDGIRFVVFNMQNTPEIKGRFIVGLAETKDGSLWIGSEEGGLTRLKDGKFSHFGKTNGLGGGIIKTLFASQDGTLWIGTQEGLCWLKDGKFSMATTKEGLASNVVRDICEGRAGQLLIVTDMGVSLFKDGQFVRHEGSKDWSFIRSACVDRENTLWLGNMEGILRVKGDDLWHFGKAEGLPDRVISLIREDSAGNIWAATTGGLCRFENGRFVSETTSDGEAYDVVNVIVEDSENNLWIGAKDGLYRLNPRRFATFTKQQGLPHNNVMSVLEDKHGTIWIAMWGGGLSRMRDGQFFTYNSTQGMTRDLALSLHEGSDSLWVGMDFTDGVFRMQDEKFTQYAFNEGFIDPAAHVVFEDSAKNVWIGTRTALNRFRDGQFTRYTTAEGLAANSVRAIMEDRAGAVWFGTADGLSRWKGGQFVTFKPDSGLSHVCAIFEDAAGVFWIGTRGSGLARFKDGKFTSYFPKDGLFDDNVFEVLEDDAGFFWMASLKGIFRVSKRQLEDFADGKIKSIDCVSYGKADGVLSTQCNGVAKPSAWKGRDGRMWFATTRGLVMTDPTVTAARNEKPPAVVIEQVIADKKKMENGEWKMEKSARLAEHSQFSILHPPSSLVIPPGRGELEFHYTALSFRAPEKIQFRYKLEGVDRDWVEAGSRRSAHYNNIYPGSYNFRVIACNNDGLWNELGSSVKLSLQPHFWQTWWFRGLLFLAGLTLVAGIVRYVSIRKLARKLALLEKETAIANERSRIAQDMHDELGARLTQIILLSDLAKGSKGRPDEMETHVERIAGAAHDVAGNLDGIVWAVNPENDSLDRLVGYIHEFAEMFLESASIRCRLEAPATLPETPLSSELRHNLFLVIKETLNNIVKHSGASEVKIRFQLSAAVLRIAIEDNGKGFSTEAASAFGNGLKNMQKRIHKIGGAFQLCSELGKGTQTRIEIPI